jgi:hypothetical protein
MSKPWELICSPGGGCDSNRGISIILGPAARCGFPRDDPNSGYPHPGKMSLCCQHTFLDTKRDFPGCKSQERRSLFCQWKGSDTLITAINCLIVTHEQHAFAP